VSVRNIWLIKLFAFVFLPGVILFVTSKKPIEI